MQRRRQSLPDMAISVSWGLDLETSNIDVSGLRVGAGVVKRKLAQELGSRDGEHESSQGYLELERKFMQTSWKRVGGCS